MKIREEVVNWLLEHDNPPVRYLSLINLLKKTETDSNVLYTRPKIKEYTVSKEILSQSDKFLGEHKNLKWEWNYKNKYWQIIFLSQFLAGGKDPRIARGVNEILDNLKWIKKSGAQCLTASILSALNRLGYNNHPVVSREIETLAKRIIADKGIICNEMNNSLYSDCYMAQPKLLLLFADIPADKRTDAQNTAVKLMVNKLINNEIHIYVPSTQRMWQKILEKAPKRVDLPEGQKVKDWIHGQRKDFLKVQGLGERIPKKGWLKFGFPLPYNSDILEALYALALLKIPMQKSFQKPLDVILQKMTHDGKWIMDNSLNDKMLVNVEEKGKPSKWLTYYALFVLNHFRITQIDH